MVQGRVSNPPAAKAMPVYNLDSPELLENLAASQHTAIFELLHTGISILDREGYFRYASKAFVEMFGLPEDIRGKHVSDFFLTAEQGVMKTIRTRKATINSSVTKDNAQGVSFRYPVLDADNNLLGVIIESISTSIGKDALLGLQETIRNLEEKTNYLEGKSHKNPGLLHTFDNIIGESAVMEAMKKRGSRFARSDEPILLSGESGTGKDIIAQALHSASPRAANPFVTVNCAALPQDLMESELFGYGGGAFTGAKSGGMKGKFELADTGTIFLDEIGELSLPMQAKLLRVLESGEIQKIAHPGAIHSNFRLIAATNRNLEQLVEAGGFREDLYHRLNILELDIPPLRERVSDIPLLARSFIEWSVGPRRARAIHVSSELYQAFSLYPWHGNVRELKNILTFALYSLEDDGDILTIQHLPDRFLKELRNAQKERESETPADDVLNLTQVGAQAERRTLLSVLESTENNKARAARLLGISRNTLYRKIRALGV
ncbi:sigma-54-dependent Fis family transcriptional regulator [Betaproteobacteria bacterium]|nr:sigma-54-dependent Fis family transcriptional regulator [Betaproteobacteria bacterium]GHU19178.1 sigma-54-dependent Fis family transcriptional regulator [Betaproteobacteria bacterium]